MIQRGKKVSGQLSAADHNAQEAFRGSFSGYERNRFFARLDGTTGFKELGYPLGLDFEHDGRAAAPIDVDGDGDIDCADSDCSDFCGGGRALQQHTTGTSSHTRRPLPRRGGAPDPFARTAQGHRPARTALPTPATGPE